MQVSKTPEFVFLPQLVMQVSLFLFFFRVQCAFFSRRALTHSFFVTVWRRALTHSFFVTCTRALFFVLFLILFRVQCVFFFWACAYALTFLWRCALKHSFWRIIFLFRAVFLPELVIQVSLFLFFFRVQCAFFFSTCARALWRCDGVHSRIRDVHSRAFCFAFF